VWAGILATDGEHHAKFTGLVFLCFVFAAAGSGARSGGASGCAPTGLVLLTLLLGTGLLGYILT